MISLMCALALADPATEQDFRSHIDQARFFIQKQWYDDALQELEKAIALEDGRIDPEAWYLLASVRYELADVVGARAAAARAHSYSRTEEQLLQASGLSSFLDTQFGLVTVSGPQEGVTTELDLTLKSMLFDPGLKLYLDRLTQKLAGSQLLPLTVGLPAGSYEINGREITIEPATEHTVKVAVQSRAPVGIQLAELELGLGASAWLGSDVRNLLPGPHTQIALSQPIGPVVFGVMVDWAARPYQTRDGITLSPLGFSAGARLGVELGPEPLRIRPSLGYRYGLLPGIELPCARLDDDSSWTCTDGGDAQLLVYGVARAHMPQVELAAFVMKRDRPRPVGGGIKVVGETAFGSLPPEATASRLGTRDPEPYVVEGTARGMVAWGVRVLAHCSLAF